MKPSQKEDKEWGEGGVDSKSCCVVVYSTSDDTGTELKLLKIKYMWCLKPIL